MIESTYLHSAEMQLTAEKNYRITLNLPIALWETIQQLCECGHFPTKKCFIVAAIEHWKTCWSITPEQKAQFYKTKQPIFTPIIRPTMFQPQIQIPLNLSFTMPISRSRVSTVSLKATLYKEICGLYNCFFQGFSISEFYRLMITAYCLYLFHTADFPKMTFFTHTVKDPSFISKRYHFQMECFNTLHLFRINKGGKSVVFT
jgi:hypothetical protein